jgi:hypothetical protein
MSMSAPLGAALISPRFSSEYKTMQIPNVTIVYMHHGNSMPKQHVGLNGRSPLLVFVSTPEGVKSMEPVFATFRFSPSLTEGCKI